MNVKKLFENVEGNQFKLVNEADEKYEFANGLKWGIKHKKSGETLDSLLKTFPELTTSFKKGYNKSRNDPKWQRFNNALTDYLGRLGSSLINR